MAKKAIGKDEEITKVRVVNNTRGSLGFTGNDGRRYNFPRPSAFKDIEYVVIEGLHSEYPSMIEDGSVVFANKEIYDRLFIDKEIVSKIIYFNDIKEFLEQDANKIEEQLSEMPMQIKENVASVAKEMKIDSKSKVKAIKNATGFEIDADDDISE